MPNSLKAKFDKLKFKGKLTEEEHRELIEKLKGHDAELVGKSDVLDKIRAEIDQAAFKDVNGSKYIFVNRVNQIIDKYKPESENSMANDQISKIEPKYLVMDKYGYTDKELVDTVNMLVDKVNELNALIQHKTDLPPDIPKPKTGYWIRVDNNKVGCSECEVIRLIDQYPNGKIDWFTNCGTKIIELQTESEEEE